jgi:rhamnosyltransferase
MMPKRVAVLLASYNGEHFIGDQIDSIVAQSDVEAFLCISDDGSTDSTIQCIAEAASRAPDRIALLHGCRPKELAEQKFANNFYSLVDTFSIPPDVGWVALSDQDDLWRSDRLARAIGLIQDNQLAGYSSSVTAFWPDGRQSLVKKSGHISMYNHLFEAPGPGCTFVLPRSTFLALQSYLRRNYCLASRVDFHDWAIYAYVRVACGEWFIDPLPSLLYRQHDSNVMGVELSIRSVSRRLAMLFGGWYRAQCLAVIDFVGEVDSRPGLLLRRFSLLDRFSLALIVFCHRRRFRDRLLLPFAFVFMSSNSRARLR